MKATPETRRVH